MRFKGRRILLIPTMGVIASAMILFLLYERGIIREGRVRTLQGNIFPSFIASDIQGEKIASTDFLKKCTYVQISNLNTKSDALLLSRIESTYGDKLNILMMLVAPVNPAEWRSHKLTRFISSENSHLRKLFPAREYGFFYFYNARGQLIDSGGIQAGFERRIKRLLDWHVMNKKFEQNMMIPKLGGHLAEYHWLRQLEQLASNQPQPYYLFGLFSSICDSCSSGFLINMLKRIRAQAGDELGVWGILSPEYTSDDVSCLVTQLSLNFPVDVADSPLGSKWNELGATYTMNDISEIIFITDRVGKVIEIFSGDDIESQNKFLYRCLKLSTGR
jgi:hypothetical protein